MVDAVADKPVYVHKVLAAKMRTRGKGRHKTQATAAQMIEKAKRTARRVLGADGLMDCVDLEKPIVTEGGDVWLRITEDAYGSWRASSGVIAPLK